ncbi:hypothetical protein TNCV_2998381 [Trichonephila clavipes]|nr:hypothetical protein TNCV_2998381 [Trichonephila clavipes]
MPKLQTCIICTAVQMVTADLHYKCITRSFMIDECPITEFFSSYIVNFVKHFRSTSQDMMLVDEGRAIPSPRLEDNILNVVAD